MENLSLLSLVVLPAASPLAAAAAAAWSESGVACGGSSYGANSSYEANLRHHVAVLPAETAASRWHRVVDRAIGYWPNRVQASASCWTWTDNDGDCAACIAGAFKEVERECPFRREATFSSDDCYLRVAEFSIFDFGRNTMFDPLAMGMMFQAFGLACIFLMFIRVWQHDSKKGTKTRHTHTPLLSGNQ